MEDGRASDDTAETLFERFLEANKKGLKVEAKETAKALVASFKSVEEKEDWTTKNLDLLETNGAGRIRQELFGGIVYPALAKGAERGEPEAFYRLGKLWRNLLTDPVLGPQMRYAREEDYFRRAHEIEPENSKYRQGYLNARMRVHDFTFHEWPPSILIDYRKWRAEVEDLRKDLRVTRELDQENQYSEKFEYWAEALDTFSRDRADWEDERDQS